MRSVALALGWEIWRRHRLWFVLTLAWLGAAAVAVRALPGLPGVQPEIVGGIATLFPLTAVAIPFLAAFTYAQSADLAAGGTGFPARLFTAPVGTAALVGWPMLYGALTAPLRRRRPCASPAAALLWWEWRRHGLGLPVMVALTLPWALVPALLFDQDDMIRRGLLAVALALPALEAVFAGGSLGNVSNRPAPGLSPFLATRPVGSAALVAAKLKVAALITLAAWALPAVALPVALLRADVRADVAELWAALLHFYPPGKAAAAVALTVFILPALTWTGLVGSLHVTLTGRPWVNMTAVAAGLVLLAGQAGAGYWAYLHPEAHAALGRLAWWLAPAAVALKLLLAGGAVRVLLRRRLVTPRALAGWLAVWLLAALALFAALAWLLPPGLADVTGCAFAAVLTVPLARLALAPLALEWNRHR